MPADWPSSGGDDSQAPRWAVASLSRSAADAGGVAVASAATIAAMPTITFTFPACCIVAPVLLTKAGAVSLKVLTASRPPGEPAGGVDCAHGSCNSISTLQEHPTRCVA